MQQGIPLRSFSWNIESSPPTISGPRVMFSGLPFGRLSVRLTTIPHAAIFVHLFEEFQ